VNTNVSICMSVAARVGIRMCVSICVHTSILTLAMLSRRIRIIISTGISLSTGSCFSTSISAGIRVNINIIVTSSISISISTSTCTHINPFALLPTIQYPRSSIQHLVVSGNLVCSIHYVRQSAEY